MDSESRAQSQSSDDPRSKSKILVGQKRDIMETEETSESSYKRVKQSDIQSVCPSKDAICEEEMLNPVSAMSGVDTSAGTQKPIDLLNFAKEEKTQLLDLDLNTEDMSSSINDDPFHPFKNFRHVKARDDSEHESSVGPRDEKDSMRVWKGLKQNHYMSTQYGVPPMPIQKTRGRRKNTNDSMKKKIELAKKEQVDRFAKVAAPSGLLNGLNPGIINHVRNRKQVHSIIEALVRSERTENGRFGSKQGDDITIIKGEVMENDDQVDYALFSKSKYLSYEVTRGDGDSYMNETRTFGKLPSSNVENIDGGVTVASGNTSCLSIEDSGNFTTVTSLSFKAANVASQWLELLSQDIRGRLAALRRSKRRVGAVITTELPDLMSREFSSNLHKDSYVTKGSIEAHAVKWSTLFEQMDKALSEEETHLENWLNQVKEMQLHCESGLRMYNASQESGPSGNNRRLGEAHNWEKDLGVSAAAASIYSTCNFLLSMENLPCF